MSKTVREDDFFRVLNAMSAKIERLERLVQEDEVIDLTVLGNKMPDNPYDGQIADVLFKPDVRYTFKYRAFNANGSENTSPYKWESTGARVEHYIYGNATNNTTSDTWVTCGFPDLVLPFAGDYDVRVEFFGALTGATYGGSAALVPWLNGVDAGSSANANSWPSTPADANVFGGSTRSSVLTNVPASSILSARARRVTPNGTGTAFVWYPSLAVKPRRIKG